MVTEPSGILEIQNPHNVRTRGRPVGALGLSRSISRLTSNPPALKPPPAANGLKLLLDHARHRRSTVLLIQLQGGLRLRGSVEFVRKPGMIG